MATTKSQKIYNIKKPRPRIQDKFEETVIYLNHTEIDNNCHIEPPQLKETGLAILNETIDNILTEIENELQQNQSSTSKIIQKHGRDIIYRLFGFHHNYPETLESIGKDIGITRERVRQIFAHTLEKIRTNKNARALKHY